MRTIGWVLGVVVVASGLVACTPPVAPGAAHQRLVNECKVERASVRTAIEAVRAVGDPSETPETYVDTTSHRFVGWTGTFPDFEMTWLDGDLSLGVTQAECGIVSAT